MKPPPRPSSTSFLSRLLYLVLLAFLVGMTVTGPIRKITSEETTFRRGYKSPEELPAPMVTLCKVWPALGRGGGEERSCYHLCIYTGTLYLVTSSLFRNRKLKYLRVW